MGFELDMDDYWEGNRNDTVTGELADFAASGDMARVKAAVSLGADVTFDRSFALRKAAEKGHTEIAAFLIENGADVHVLDDAPLRLAVANNHGRTVSKLLQLKANPNALDGDPLIKAASRGDENMVRDLLDAGADANNSDAQAMRKAAFNGYDTVVRLLLLRGADAWAMSGSAMELAQGDRHERVIQVLAEVMNQKRDGFLAALAATPDVKAFLRADYADTTESAFVRGAKMNCLSQVIKRMKETGDKLTYADLHGLKDRSQRSLATLAAEQHRLKELFDVHLWRDNLDDLKNAWDKIPPQAQKSSGVTPENFAALSAELTQRTLKERAGKFKLKPPGA